ncbi:MAG: RNA 2',3'-cyclic phosphodiesterase [Firmicutes bacterium]|nr:RNA 2',3'-cyclic phosphodiesterase [Bacillota bacterium]
MRLFIAIGFDDATKGKILAVQRRLKELGSGRFTTPENIHLTLAFLGEVGEDRLSDVKAAMDKVTVPKLKLSFEKIGCFRRDSELWWIGLREDPALLKMQKELTGSLKDAGFKLESRKFRPHITLAREMNIGRVDSKALLPGKFETEADSISLMLSSRPNGKLTYTELYRK